VLKFKRKFQRQRVKKNALQISYKDGVCKDKSLFICGVHTIFKKIYHYGACELDMVPNYCLIDYKTTCEGQQTIIGYSVKRFDMINLKYSYNPHYFHRSSFNDTPDS